MLQAGGRRFDSSNAIAWLRKPVVRDRSATPEQREMAQAIRDQKAREREAQKRLEQIEAANERSTAARQGRHASRSSAVIRSSSTRG